MTHQGPASGLETKFCGLNERPGLKDGYEISGYASVFGLADRGGDIVERGAYARSLDRLKAQGRQVKMLWQHDPLRPIGVWDEVREDARGLFVKGRVLRDVQVGREALALLDAGAIDGLSIGYRTIQSEKSGQGRLLKEIDLWEVSLVTFPMLPDARVETATPETGEDTRDVVESLAEALADARALLA
ncbi:hypothetical protein FHS89_002562 [Rubricella aquisinus]|uniref:Prohead serine protease domain-containing protein n=1 Tax=Rubricella aquisinus TaxID=2028108 RepID=A0A840WPF8_9RHOB|nr:HK97 family phage prohead protease [Rubricella aquisinus]MBB5516531.1 hypothetical protein [Rubricella aquisinus]